MLGITQHELERCNEEGAFLQEIKFINATMKWNCPGENDHQIFLITLD